MTKTIPFELQSIQTDLSYKVRFNDCDPMGHLNNGKYIDYFVNGMEDFLFKKFRINLAEELSRGIGWVVRDHRILYLNPVKHHQTVFIKVEFVQIKEKEFEVEMQMYSSNSNRIHALIRSTFSCFNIEKKCRIPHPEKVFFSISSTVNPDLLFYQTLSERFKSIRAQKNSRPLTSN